MRSCSTSCITVLMFALACGAEEGDDPTVADGTDGSSDGSSSTASTTFASTTSDPSTTASTTTTSTSTTASTTTTSSDESTGDESTGDVPGVGCDNTDLLVCEDFESAAIGEFPDGWDRRATGTWLGGGMGVANDAAYAGAQSFRLDGSENGAQWLSYIGGLGELATRHWGRMHVRVQTPAPWPSEGVLHGDFFEARGPYGEGNVNSVRWGIVENTSQYYQWIYNVQRSSNEFATGTDYVYQWDGEWFCMEWHHDQTTQEATLWLDGTEVTAISQTAEMNPEIPIYDDISVGFANYQIANPQFVVWIDEVALDDERIGCE